MRGRRCAQPGRFPRGWLAGLWSLCVACALAMGMPARAAAPLVMTLDVRGAIGPAATEYLKQGYDKAASQGAALIVIRLDTPGGLASSMLDIVRDMLASSVPIAVYVAPSGARAASAGTYILYASHLAAMAPGTNVGASTPVEIGGGKSGEGEGKGQAQDASTRKAINDAASYIRGLAAIQGRNADWAEASVREAASVPAETALRDKVIEIVARDLDDLLAQADGRSVKLGGKPHVLALRDARVVAVEPGWRQRLLGVLTDPTIAYVLLLLGIYGLLFELASPGAMLPGILGATSLVLGLFALNLLPVNYAGASLVLLGMLLMAAEAFVTSFGVLGLGGAAVFLVGSLLMFDSGVPGYGLSLPVVITATLASAALLGIMLVAVVRAHRRRSVAGGDALIGRRGKVLEWSHGRGMVQVAGERWQARGDAALHPGDSVRVRGRDALTLAVEPDRTPFP